MSKCCDDFVVDVVFEGPQGRRGETGDVTPEARAAQVAAEAAAEQAVAAAAQVAALIDGVTPPTLDFSRPAMAGLRPYVIGI